MFNITMSQMSHWETQEEPFHSGADGGSRRRSFLWSDELLSKRGRRDYYIYKTWAKDEEGEVSVCFPYAECCGVNIIKTQIIETC